MDSVTYEKAKQKHEETIETIKTDILQIKSVLENQEKTKSAEYQTSLTTQVGQLKKLIDKEKKEGMIDINERERSKNYAIKRLSEEMDFKVKETEANLRALNDE